jgi:hypothetical protein
MQKTYDGPLAGPQGVEVKIVIFGAASEGMCVPSGLNKLPEVSIGQDNIWSVNTG